MVAVVVGSFEWAGLAALEGCMAVSIASLLTVEVPYTSATPTFPSAPVALCHWCNLATCDKVRYTDNNLAPSNTRVYGSPINL